MIATGARTNARLAALRLHLPLALCVLAIAGGLAARAWDLHVPPAMTFDEDHFVKNARNYLAGRADWNDHPPLGKLILAVGILGLGDGAPGWRIFPLLFGIASVGFAFFSGRAIAPENRAVPLLAAAFVAVDGFFIAFSRTALLDGMLASLALLELGIVLRLRRRSDILAASLVIAAAVSIKWSGIALVLPLAVQLWRRRLLRDAWILAVIPAGYAAIFAFGLWLTGRAPTPAAIWEANRALLVHHLGLTDMRHPATSRWWTWLWLENPITLRRIPVAGGRVAVLSTLGNPLLWWASSLAILVALTRLRRMPELGIVLLAWAAPLLPWILTRRDSYIYHYLPSYGPALLVLAAIVGTTAKRRLAAIFCVAALGASIYFAPLWAQLPLRPGAVASRMWLPKWP